MTSGCPIVGDFLGSYPVHVERHTSQNSSRGDIHTDSHEGMSAEEILFALAGQFVSLAYTLIGKGGNKPFPLSIIFLIFEVPSLPATLHIGYESFLVRQYFPKPTRCYRCQKFCHTQQSCAYCLVSGRFGESRHGEDRKRNSQHCRNCSRAHASADSKCPFFLEEKALQELRVRHGLSNLYARKEFVAHQRTTGTKSYAVTVRRPSVLTLQRRSQIC